MKIEIYDPAMCCSTGVCGPSVDPEFVRIQEALRQIQKQAPRSPSGSLWPFLPALKAFVTNAAVSRTAEERRPECLPLVFV